MPSWAFDGPWWVYALWNLGAFLFSFIPNSFMEWTAHRFILHSKAIVKFAYEEHDQNHHYEYLGGSTFSIPGKDYGVDFGVRDWLLFIVFVMPMWAGVEYLSGKPILLGTAISTCLWLHMFNVVHRHFHAPNGAWIERTAYYKFLMRHHRRHHMNTATNFNVAFLPIADWALGTLKAESKG